MIIIGRVAAAKEKKWHLLLRRRACWLSGSRNYDPECHQAGQAAVISTVSKWAAWSQQGLRFSCWGDVRKDKKKKMTAPIQAYLRLSLATGLVPQRWTGLKARGKIKMHLSDEWCTLKWQHSSKMTTHQVDCTGPVTLYYMAAAQFKGVSGVTSSSPAILQPHPLPFFSPSPLPISRCGVLRPRNR